MRITRSTSSLVFVSLCWLLTGCSCRQSSASHEATRDMAPTATVAAAPVVESAAQSAALGKPAPGFALPSLGGARVNLAQYKGKIVVLEWFNPACPFVKQGHEEGELKGLAARVAEKGVVWLAINSGAPGMQGHGAEVNQAGKQRFGIQHPILLDEDGKVGRMYGAERTPHMYVINAEGVLVYRGAIDNLNGGDREDVAKVENYVVDAITDLQAGRPVARPEVAAYGCGVKYAH